MDFFFLLVKLKSDSYIDAKTVQLTLLKGDAALNILQMIYLLVSHSGYTEVCFF